MNNALRRSLVFAAGGALVLTGLIKAGQAAADPYQLPIASSGLLGIPSSASPRTVSMQELSRQVGLAVFTASDWRIGTVRQMVMLQYKQGVSAAERAEVTARFLHLAQDSRRPDGRHVVARIETGSQNSGEGMDDGLEQVFLLTFRSEGDRNFYVGRPVVDDPAFFDPAHEAFKEFASAYVQKAVVFDYDVALTTDEVSSSRGHSARKGRR